MKRNENFSLKRIFFRSFFRDTYRDMLHDNGFCIKPCVEWISSTSNHINIDTVLNSTTIHTTWVNFNNKTKNEHFNNFRQSESFENLHRSRISLLNFKNQKSPATQLTTQCYCYRRRQLSYLCLILLIFSFFLRCLPSLKTIQIVNFP